MLVQKPLRVSNLYKIKDKNSQQVVFKRNRAQRDFHTNRTNRNIVLKSRQLGFTTDACIDSLDDTIFNKNFDSLIISYDKETTEDAFDNKVDYAWQNLDERIRSKVTIETDTKRKLKFAFRDGSASSIAVRMSGRGGTHHRVHISEFAKICKLYPKKAKEIITGTLQSVPLHGRIDIESTAEGEVGFFHDMFWEAWLRGEPTLPTQYKAHFYNWTWDDEEIAKAPVIAFADMDRGAYFEEYAARHSLSQHLISYYYLKWLEVQKDFDLLQQEYPTTPEEAFISSGNKLISPETIKTYEPGLQEGRRVDDWIIYSNYNPKHNYGLGADVAEGVGRDSCTIVIWDFSTPKPRIVAEYASDKIAPDIFAYEIKRGGEWYGRCIAAPERNNHGMATITKLKEIYPLNRIYSVMRMDERTQKETLKLGWATTAASKPKMMYDLATAIENNEVDIPSRTILNEVRTYDKDDLNVTRFDEDSTNHWDRVIAAAIGWQMKAHAEPMVVVSNKRLRGL